MKKDILRIAVLTGVASLVLAACSTAPRSYQPASGSAYGYAEQPIEKGRYRVSYTAETEDLARRYALRRAAEVTDFNGGDWFRVVHASSSGPAFPGRSSPSVSVGGSVGSGGYSGVGIGIGIPIGGGGGDQQITHSLEILIGTGPKPDDFDVYDAEDVLISSSGF